MSHKMRRTFFIMPAMLLLALSASGQTEAFKLVARHSVVFHGRKFPSSSSAQVNKAENTLTFSGSSIRIVALAGPEDNMFSYRIAGLTNPTLRIPAGARVRLTVVNVDDDMSHDLVVSPPHKAFPARPEIPPHAVRTTRLAARHGEACQGEVLLIQAMRAALCDYFCSVPGHAKGGMHGRLEVLNQGGSHE